MMHFILRISDWGASAAASVGASLELSGGCVLIIGGVMAKKSKSNYHLHKQLDMFQKQDQPKTEAEKVDCNPAPELTPVVQAPLPPAAQQLHEAANLGADRKINSANDPLAAHLPVRCPQCGGPCAMSINFDHKGEYYCAGACSYGTNFYFRI